MKSIDERIVDMQFNNKQFEAGIQTSLKSIDNLKKGLDDTEKGASLTGIQTTIQGISDKFSLLGIMGVTALQNIAQTAINTGVQLAKSLALDPIMDGFNEYELKMGSIQTIMAGSGESLETVNRYLDELNTYADKTIYSFKDMTSNIGKFTNAGVKLEDAVSAIQGVSNLAAVSGANANEASRAMYNFAQALSSGAVKLIDWKSIENANMATVEFKNELLEAAVAAGTLEKRADGMYNVLTLNGAGGALNVPIDAVNGFNESLAYQWMTIDTLVPTLNKYSDENTELGKKAFAAAQDVKTFTQLMDTLKEAVGSGWSQTFEILIGNFEEAKALFTAINNVISGVVDSSSAARNDLLSEWKELGGRTELLEGLKNIFEAFVIVLNSIKEAFREIFPPVTAEKLLNLTQNFKDFTEHLKLSDTNSANLKKTFEGLFSVFDLGVKIIGFLLDVIKEIVVKILPAGDGILEFTGIIGEFLKSLNESVESTKSFETVFDIIKTVIETVSDVISKAFERIKDVFENFGNIDLSGLKTFSSEATNNFKPLETIGKVISGIFESIKSLLEKISPFISTIATAVGKAFAKLGEAFGGAFRDGGFQGLIDLINGGIFATILLGLKKFIDSFTELTDNAGGFIEGITGILDGVKGSLEAYQKSLKADILIKIATAIGILAASLLVLSTIDPEKLGPALLAMTALFTELSISMVLLQKALPDGKMTKVSSEMILMSAALLILSEAMTKLAELSWEEIVKGATAIGILSAILVKTAEALSQNQDKLTKGGLVMIEFAAAILILGQAVIQLGELEFEELAKGLGGVGVLMAEVAGFTQIVNPEKLQSTGFAMIEIGAALKIMASAVSDLGELDLETLIKGLTGIGIVLAEIAGFTQIVDPEKLRSSGFAMIEIGAALLIIAEAVQSFGSMSLEELAKGLAGMAGALTEIIIAMKLIPNDISAKAAGMLILSAALIVLSEAMQNMGEMSWEEIAKALVALAGGLTIMAVAMIAMEGGLAGAAAMTVMSAGIMLLAPALALLGNLELETIGTALLALVGVFAVLGASAVILAPLTPVILALAAAVALLGVGVVAIGAGLLAFSAGLTALAVASAAGGEALISLLESLIGLIPTAIEALAEGLVLAAEAIEDGIPSIMNALGALIDGLIDLFGEKAPSLLETVFDFIDELLDKLVEYVPKFTDKGLKIVTGFLKGIADNIEEVVKTGADIIVGFLQGIADKTDDIVKVAVDVISAFIKSLGEEIPRLTRAGFDMLVDFINGMAENIRTGAPEMASALVNLAFSIVEGLIMGLISGIVEIGLAIKRIFDSIIDKFKELFGIHSPSTVMDGIGGNIITGLINGIGGGLWSLIEKAKELGNSVIDNIKNIFSGVGSIAWDLVTGLGNGIRNGISTVADRARELAQSAWNAITDFFDSHSPSRKMMGLGEDLDRGLIIGLDTLSGAVAKEARNVGSEAMDSLKSAMKHIYNIIDDDSNFNPTIRPVIDFTAIDSGLSAINSKFADAKTLNVDLSSVAAAHTSTHDAVQTTREPHESVNSIQPIQNFFNLSGLVIRKDSDIDDIAAKLYQKQQQALRGKGIRAGILL